MEPIEKRRLTQTLTFFLPFLSKVALICNLCFLGALVLRVLPESFNGNGFWIRTLLVAGLFLAIPINLGVIAVSLIQGRSRSKPSGFFPRFYFWGSVLMCLSQLLFWFYR